MSFQSDETKIWNASLKQVDITNKQLVALYQQSQKEVEKTLMDFAISQLKGGVIDIEEQTRLQLLLREINKEIATLQIAVKGTITRGYANNFLRTYYFESFAIEKAINTQLNLESDFFLNAPIVNKDAVIASQAELIGGNTFRDRILQDQRIMQFRLREAVGASIIQGESVKQLADRLALLDDVYAKSAGKALTTARTELLTAYSKGQELAIDEAETAGVQFNFVWSTTLHGARPTHVIADKQKALIIKNQPVFTVGGVKFSSPRIVSSQNTSPNTAKEVVNCRCRRRNQPFGIEPTKRVAKRKDGRWVKVNGDVTAEEWMKREYDIKINKDVKTTVKA